MNFYDLFEAKKDSEEHQDVTIADPKAALALKAARNKYSYADSDLEAFIKMQQDEQEQDEKDIDKLEKEFAQHEELITKNRKTVAKLRQQEQETNDLIAQQEDQIANLKAMTLDQENELTKLRAAEKDFQAMANQYNDWASSMKAEIEAMQAGLTGVETPQGNYKPSGRLPNAPAAPRRQPPVQQPQTVEPVTRSTVFKRRFDNE